MTKLYIVFHFPTGTCGKIIILNLSLWWGKYIVTKLSRILQLNKLFVSFSDSNNSHTQYLTYTIAHGANLNIQKWYYKSYARNSEFDKWPRCIAYDTIISYVFEKKITKMDTGKATCMLQEALLQLCTVLLPCDSNEWALWSAMSQREMCLDWSSGFERNEGGWQANGWLS